MKPLPVADWVLHHHYPKILFNYPHLIRLLYLWNHLMLKRVRVVKKGLRKRLKTLPNACVLEIGFGEGMYLSWMKNRFPSHTYFGLDRERENVEFLRRYCPDIELVHADIERTKLAENQYDLVLLIGVLHYIKDDNDLLEAIHKSLKVNGYLQIYVPIEGREVLSFLTQVYSNGYDYEQAQCKQRIYKYLKIKELITRSGFEIVGEVPTYGTLGTAAHEWYRYCLHHILKARLWAGLALAATWWAVALAIRLDRPTHPNGLWIEAKKKS